MTLEEANKKVLADQGLSNYNYTRIKFDGAVLDGYYGYQELKRLMAILEQCEDEERETKTPPLVTVCPFCDEEFLDTFECCAVMAPMIENPPYFRIVCGKCKTVYFYDPNSKKTRKTRKEE